jgi:hypothetical protein
MRGSRSFLPLSKSPDVASLFLSLKKEILGRSVGAVVATMVALPALGPPVHAATIHYDAGLVTAIEALDVGGTLYNVDFEAPAYSTYPGDLFFWPVAGEAALGVSAINAVLNSNLPAPNGKLNNPIEIAYQVGFSSGIAFVGSNGSGSEAAEFTSTFNVFASDTDLLTAWSLAPVPVPAAVWLFGSALGLLGWMRRRKAS